VQRACLGPRRSGVLPPPHPRRPARDCGARGCEGQSPSLSSAMGRQPRRAGVATRGTPARRCTRAAVPRVDTKAIAALPARAASGAGRTPYHSLGGDGDRAEGRTPFAALSAGARGGLKARSACRQRTPSAPHPTCTRHVSRCPTASARHRRLAPACAVPATALHQRTSAPAGHAPPAPGTAPEPAGATLPGVPARASQGPPPPPGAPPRPPGLR